MKKVEVSVVYRGSNRPKILIELTPLVANLLMNNHENIKNCVRNDIAKALDFISAQQPITEDRNETNKA